MQRPIVQEGLRFIVRPSEDRQLDDRGRLRSFRTFNVSTDPSNNNSFGALRVLNECRVDASTGFGMPGNRDFEVFTYVISGNIERRDTAGHVDRISRGDVQLSSAGADTLYTGRTVGPNDAHFMQVWCRPRFVAFATREYIRHFTAEEMWNRWACVVAPAHTSGTSLERTGTGPAPIQAALTLHVAVLSPGSKLYHMLTSRRAYLHIPQTSGYNTRRSIGARVLIRNESRESAIVEVREGDGAYILGTEGDAFELENIASLYLEQRKSFPHLISTLHNLFSPDHFS